MIAVVTDRLTDEVRQESPWTMNFADDIVIFSESRAEESLERWMCEELVAVRQAEV